ncbi:hypothetical protein N7510_003456 [Penicillium lagena]|uniref:uncharacterized protein n=1 Tax=Penicillium lagena TaxID=94218 RepID=UPI002540A911|nr:uncharacterized protein N7510_003456 [Penicillium lagena]KAJ5619472.1 hypothetical protein N7510_003456 [Penicillium lagena]
MEPSIEQYRRDDRTFWAPGTVELKDVHQAEDQIVLFPMPTVDPDDPLNWSTSRKAINFTLVSFFVLWTFVQLDIAFTAWGPMQTELNFSISHLNGGSALTYGGLAIGCFFFVPLVHKYGRRPLYLFSISLQFIACLWQARIHTVSDLFGSGFISGLGGATSEVIVQVTIADMFFVHQHATMNGWFQIFQCTGAFLGPVAAGYIVDSEGWRWIWWWCAIFFGVTLLCVVFLFEESKYVPVHNSQGTTSSSCPELTDAATDTKNKMQEENKGDSDTAITRVTTSPQSASKTYCQRMSLITKTDEPIWHHFVQPIVVLFSFPAVTYCALTYGTTLAWFAIMTSIQATYLLEPPYNFNAIGIGLMNIAPFAGAVIGFPFGGYLSDKSIMWLANRNNGIYEPEMRIWLALPLAIISPGGILMFGLGLAHGAPWILLAMGFSCFGFSFASVGAISLSYAMDCYQDIIGDALVGVVFTRNIFSLIILFVITPWVQKMGMQNLHILVAVLAFEDGAESANPPDYLTNSDKTMISDIEDNYLL